MNRIARCCCGNCTIEVTGEPEMHGVCHCSNCKRRTGSAFGISSYFKNDQLLNKVGEFSCYALENTEQNHDQERFIVADVAQHYFGLSPYGQKLQVSLGAVLLAII